MLAHFFSSHKLLWKQVLKKEPIIKPQCHLKLETSTIFVMSRLFYSYFKKWKYPYVYMLKLSIFSIIYSNNFFQKFLTLFLPIKSNLNNTCILPKCLLVCLKYNSAQHWIFHCLGILIYFPIICVWNICRASEHFW